MNRINLLLGAMLMAVLLFTGCSSGVEEQGNENTPVDSTAAPALKEGRWRAALNIGKEELPFNFIVENGQIIIINGEERIKIDDITIDGDRFTFRLPLFDSEFKGVFINDSLIEGEWHNYNKGESYAIPFVAEHGKKYRFVTLPTEEPALCGGIWEADFSPGTPDAYKAKGIFKNEGHTLYGTFLTETGDYRFLEGIEQDNKVYLSCFDGAHAFLFKAHRTETDSLIGTFWSGTHWKENWVAVRNADFELTNPDSLTHLVDSKEQVTFSLPDADGKTVSLSDERFKGKVVIVQIMGTWCPNCLDETAFYAEIYKKYHDLGVEIIAVAFEQNNATEHFKENVQRIKEKYDVDYTFLLGGKANKSHAHDIFPMLNNVISYPTSIFIDKNGKVRKIHTGFYGPGTGEYYDQYKSNILELLERLLRE